LAEDITGADDELLLLSGVMLSEVVAGTWAQIGDELVAVLALAGSILTVDRGVLDTTPVPHLSGTRVWFGGSRRGEERIERAADEDVDLKLLTRTGLGSLPIADAAALPITLAERLARPYAPGNVTLNSEPWPDEITGNLTIAWAHRDRTQQTAYLVAQDETDIGPEAGTTYTVKIYDGATDTLKRTYSGITGTSQAYTEAQRITDFGGSGPEEVRVEITAQRDSLDSWQAQVRRFSWP
jgi:hypothetical protein